MSHYWQIFNKFVNQKQIRLPLKKKFQQISTIYFSILTGKRTDDQKNCKPFEVYVLRTLTNQYQIFYAIIFIVIILFHFIVFLIWYLIEMIINLVK